MTAIHPSHAPLTSDLCILHGPSGTKVFVEIKPLMSRVSDLENGRQLFEHKARHFAQTARYIFTFRAPWDYILTTFNENEGLLFSKDDVPFDFWHQELEDAEDWLQHTFQDHSFVNSHRIKLNQSAPQIAQTISRILKGPGSTAADPPRTARLTAQGIIDRAPPCTTDIFVPQLTIDAARKSTSAPNVPGLQNAIEVMQLDDEENSERDDANDEDDNEYTGLIRGVQGERQQISGGNSLPRTADLANVLMRQCRAT